MRRLLWLALPLWLSACTPGAGQRCNPLQFTSDCDKGFSCVYPAGCGVAYCCPDDGQSSNANCQPCPTGDGGSSD